MSITADELARAGKAGLDYFLKNNPIDQVDMQKPFLKAMQAKKKKYPGGKKYVVEQLRTNYGSSGQWFDSVDTLGYSNRDSLAQSQFPWYEFHDGMMINEAELVANGIKMDDSGKGGNITDAEKIQLTDKLQEIMAVLKLGAQDRFSRDIQLGGGGSTKQIVGLDALVSLTPAIGAIGGIDRATAAYWRNVADKTLTTANMLTQMEKAWRACIKHSSGVPDLILAGGDFIDAYRAAAQTSGNLGQLQRVVSDPGKGGVNLDMSVTGLFYKGVPIQYCPEWDDDFGGADTTTTPWAKRCYFINQNHMFLRPIDGSDFVSRTPPRAKENYNHYWALLWRGTLTMNMASAHAVLALA